MTYPTVVLDNFFEDIDSVIEMSSTIPFKSQNDEVPWPGQRSNSVKYYYEDFSRSVFQKIISNYSEEIRKNLKYENFELIFSKASPGEYPKSWYHPDPDADIATVIYLSDGDINTGTTVLTPNFQKHVIAAGIKNTSISYDAKKYHATTSFNTKPIYGTRHTLLGFIWNESIVDGEKEKNETNK